MTINAPIVPHPIAEKAFVLQAFKNLVQNAGLIPSAHVVQ